MKRLQLHVAAMALVCLLLVCAAAQAGAFSEARDPFVARPLGPYTLLANPAAAMETDALTVRAATGQGLTAAGSDGTRLVAYLEPDTGLGAGALWWHGATLVNGSTRREVGYTVARSFGSGFVLGVSLKNVHEGNIGVWTADVGVLTPERGRLRAGLVVHNLLSQHVIAPPQVTGGVSITLGRALGVSAAVTAPTLTAPDSVEAGIAVDLNPHGTTRLRVGRMSNVATARGYWIGAFQVDLRSFVLDASFMVDDADNRRIAVGLLYRF